MHGSLKTRGNILEGVVVSDKSKKTVIVEHAYTTFLHKYERSLRKTSRIAAYNPECINAKSGDKVAIAETRRLSKTKSFAVIKIIDKVEA